MKKKREKKRAAREAPEKGTKKKGGDFYQDFSLCKIRDLAAGAS